MTNFLFKNHPFSVKYPSIASLRKSSETFSLYAENYHELLP